jgi:hypothetical protein
MLYYCFIFLVEILERTIERRPSNNNFKKAIDLELNKVIRSKNGNKITININPIIFLSVFPLK